MQAVERQFQTIGDAELVVDLAQVILDDLLGRANLVRDFFIAHAAGDARDDGKFLG